MKRLILLYITLAASLAQAQKISEDQVPTNVKSAFQKAYPNAGKTKWSKEDDKFEVEFNLNKSETSVLMDMSGSLLEIEVEIDVSQLPKEVHSFVKSNYRSTIKEAGKITDSKGIITYEAEVKGKDLIFDENGKFIKESKK